MTTKKSLDERIDSILAYSRLSICQAHPRGYHRFPDGEVAKDYCHYPSPKTDEAKQAIKAELKTLLDEIEEHKYELIGIETGVKTGGYSIPLSALANKRKEWGL